MRKRTGLPVNHRATPQGQRGTGTRVRKKACPYCGKRLQAKSKGQWRNNLARHLGNTCAEYARQNINRYTELVTELIKWFLPRAPAGAGDYLAAQNKKAEVSELERLAKL
jgi:hypothetical protein